MKLFRTLTGLLAGLALLLAVAGAGAATWNDSYGMGNVSDDWLITGSGVPFTAIGSVQSNSLYYVTSAKASGAPRLGWLWVQSDLLASTLGYYVATATYSVASNGIAGTNVINITSTNGLGNGDILVYRHVATDTYQMLVNSNNSALALVTYNALSNAPAANDVLYKMTRVANFNPLQMHAVTNQVIRPLAELIPFGVSSKPVELTGELGLPSLTVLTYSNAGGLFITGDYFVRPRR